MAERCYSELLQHNMAAQHHPPNKGTVDSGYRSKGRHSVPNQTVSLSENEAFDIWEIFVESHFVW